MKLHSAKRFFAMIFLAALALPGWAFNLDDLQTQLQAMPVVRGDFTQKKFLRSLPQALTSRGTFTLATGKGLLWRARTPINLDMRITQQGIARLEPDGTWQASMPRTGSSQETDLFLALLSGNTQGLKNNFDITLNGDKTAWQLTMTPHSALLKQIFKVIHVSGASLVDTIELRETQGDRSVLQMLNAQAVQQLTEDEARAFAN